MPTEKDFDWSLTNRKLVIMMPNWGRGDYIKKTVETIETVVPAKDWIILVANDGLHEDLYDLDDQNVVFFTFQRENISERNGCFIRNFVIKRLQSERVFIKDPEIIIEGDFIRRILVDCDKPLYRLGGDFACKASREITGNFMAGNATIQDCITNSQKHPIYRNQHMIMHYGYSMPVATLQQMKGYDEDYSVSPYCEDRDIFYRFVAQELPVFFDKQCFPIHLWHEMKFFPNTPENAARYEKAKALFHAKDPTNFIRNPNGWGTGRPDIGSFTNV